MSHLRRSYTSKRRLHTAAKVTALIAALGFVTLMLEHPRLTAAPSHPRATIEQNLEAIDSGEAPMAGFEARPAGALESRLPSLASENSPADFSWRSVLPSGEVEPPAF
jgi:hypothetical protein